MPVIQLFTICRGAKLVCRWWLQPPPGGGALLMPCVPLCVSGWSLIHHTVPRSGCRKICHYGISLSDEDVWGFKSPKAVRVLSLQVNSQEMRKAQFLESVWAKMRNCRNQPLVIECIDTYTDIRLVAENNSSFLPIEKSRKSNISFLRLISAGGCEQRAKYAVFSRPFQAFL